MLCSARREQDRDAAGRGRRGLRRARGCQLKFQLAKARWAQGELKLRDAWRLNNFLMIGTACAVRRCAASRPRAGSHVATRTGPRSPTVYFVGARRFRLAALGGEVRDHAGPLPAAPRGRAARRRRPPTRGRGLLVGEPLERREAGVPRAVERVRAGPGPRRAVREGDGRARGVEDEVGPLAARERRGRAVVVEDEAACERRRGPGTRAARRGARVDAP